MEPLEKPMEIGEEEKETSLGFFFFLRNGFRCSCLLPSGGASEDVHALSGICAAEPNPLRSPDPLRLDLTVSISQRQPQPH